MRERAILEQFPQVAAVYAVLDSACKPSANLRSVAVPNRVDQKLSQRSAFELKLAQYIENLPAQGLACLFELLEEATIDVALAGFVRDQLPEMTGHSRTQAIDQSEA